MPRLAVVLDDPRLAVARDRARDKDWSAAAGAVDAAMATASLDALHACEWAYVAGTLHAQADEHADAATAFDRARGNPDDAGASCPLAPYATLRAAEALVHAGRFDEALAHARAAVDEVASHDEAKLALADAFVGKGNRTEAIPIWRELLAASPHGLRWADSSMQLATALLDGVDGPPETRAQEALDLATRVFVEAPLVAEKVDVLGLRSRAGTLLHLTSNPPPLTPEERARQAQAWLDAKQPKRAVEVAEALLKSLPSRDAKHRGAGCQAAIVHAQATPRGLPGEGRKNPDVVADAWSTAITRCEGEDELVTALYNGAKASNSAHRRDEALARFARVEKLFPHHRFADDARLHEAQIVADGGDEARAVTMLGSIPADYPDGDIKGEALFRVALAKLGHRDLEGARSALDAILALPHDEHLSNGTDRAAYFRARVAQLAGDAADSKARYTAMVSDHPLGYYMLLAYGRLRAMDAGAARAAVDAAVAREANGPFLTRPHPELQSPAFVRFVRLLEVGDIDDARREANAGGLVADGVDPEVLWTVAWCYDHAGAADAGHAYARARLSDWRVHWPAGRWRLAWEVAFPRPWQDTVTTESASAGIPEPLTWAIMREESAFNPDAKSAANAIGLMQLLVGTARLVSQRSATPPATPVDEAALHKPEVSIAIGAHFLGSLRASFPEDKALAIAAYNGGAGAVRRWLTERGADEFDLFVERIPYDETRNYLKRVLASEAAYAYLYAPSVLEEVLALPRRASGQEMIATP
jgi:soluble lytic murein transglycosylase